MVTISVSIRWITSEQVPARPAHVVELAVQEVVSLLSASNSPPASRFTRPSRAEPPLDELGLALEPGHGVVLGQLGHRVLGSRWWPSRSTRSASRIRRSRSPRARSWSS